MEQRFGERMPAVVHTPFILLGAKRIPFFYTPPDGRISPKRELSSIQDINILFVSLLVLFHFWVDKTPELKNREKRASIEKKKELHGV